MNYILRDLSQDKEYQKFNDFCKKNYSDNNKIKSPITLSGLVCVSKSAIVALTQNEEKKPILIVTYNELQAQKLSKDLQYFCDNVMLFPKREIAIYDYDVESNDIIYNRIDVLNKIMQNKAPIIITTIEAIMQKMPAKEDLYNEIIHLKQGDTISTDVMKEKLVKLGYERKNLVENRAEFSIRGDIIDIGLCENEGVRIELWGDEIDSIRKFKITSQRSTEMIKELYIYPAKEEILVDTIDVITKRIENTIANIKSQELISSVHEDIEAIRNGDFTNKIDKYFNRFYQSQQTLFDYTTDYITFFDEPEKILQRIEGIKEDNKNLSKELLEKGRTIPEALENLVQFNLEKHDVINLKEADELKSGNEDCHFELREISLFKGDMKSFEAGVQEASQNQKKVIILAGNEANRDKIAKEIENASKVDEIDNILLKPGQIIIATGALSSGFENKQTGLEVISSDEFLNTGKRKLKRPNDTFKNAEKIVFADLKVGDLVVHRNHGIAVFTGVKTIENDGVTKDYICLKYRDDDVLYVPTENLDNVRKYIGQEGGVKLNKLGTKEWQETKAKIKGNLRAVAKDLIELYAKRERSKGHAYSKDTPWQEQFEASFPYQETDDQIRCIKEVKQDMESNKPMDRLLCGDVGYGKTEVAIRAAFKAVMDGKQVAYLAPTTILANQQYQEFKERMKEYPIRIELLNRFRTAKQQKETIHKLKYGNADIVIGTHRMLSKDVEFSNLGLLIIDEEQRFGVKAKEKIKKYKESIDVLTMTATPIPRTLQMSIVGIRDMSVIYEPPHNRKPIQTYVLEYDKEVIREAITKELERDGQVFYIFNNVGAIATKALEIEELVPEARVGFAHGKMTGQEIEEIMEDFVEKKTNVLVCTTILESGIDIPNANTIIVENADRFGLAQLYQIRGRVGRSNRQAYAYITYRRDKMISEDANQRLKAIKEFTEFGSGFKIATRDLQIRGAGSLFGEVQSGHMEQVGYDMYKRLLDEVVKEEKGEKVEEDIDITIDLNISSYIPEKYIEDPSQKIEIYQDIANCRNENDIQNIIDEIIDRYGEMPSEVENLIEIARIKNIAREKNIIKIQSRPMGIVFTFSEFNGDNIEILLKKYKNNIQFSAAGKPYITLKVKNNEIQETKEFLNTLK